MINVYDLYLIIISKHYDIIGELRSKGIRFIGQKFLELFKLYIARLIFDDSFMNCFNKARICLKIKIMEHLIGIILCEVKEIFFVVLIKKSPDEQLILSSLSLFDQFIS